MYTVCLGIKRIAVQYIYILVNRLWYKMYLNILLTSSTHVPCSIFCYLSKLTLTAPQHSKLFSISRLWGTWDMLYPVNYQTPKIWLLMEQTRRPNTQQIYVGGPVYLLFMPGVSLLKPCSFNYHHSDVLIMTLLIVSKYKLFYLIGVNTCQI